MRRMYSKKQLEEIAKDYIHEHEDVIANPQVTGTEDLLRTIEIDGEKYILPENAEVTASEIDSEEATSGQVLMADGEGGASWGTISTDKPIHFIKLTSTTLTEALRNEILSDEYFVVLEYQSNYYYEQAKTTTYKTFETLIGTYIVGSEDYDRYWNFSYKSLSVANDSLSFSITTNERYVIKSNGANVPASKINSKTSSSANATAGKVLTANGSGGTSWESVSQLGYLTTAPSSDNTSGVLQIVVLSSEPGTKYNGYLYIITGA